MPEISLITGSTKKVVSLFETNLVVEGLFKWLRDIDDIPCIINLDYVADTAPCLAFITGESTKIKADVIGGYTARLDFSILYKIKGETTKSRLEANRFLMYLANYFEGCDTICKLPLLTDRDIPINLELIENPTLIGNEDNGNQVYAATYALIYKHKSQYED